MPRTRKDARNVRLTPWAKRLLDEHVDALSTTPPVLPVKDYELVGALIYAARRSPSEAVRAVVQTYRDKEAEAQAVSAVIEFVRACAR